jgi:hypothetical protein
VNDKRGSDGLEETKKAFDFMLNYVGNDVASGPVWMDYIAFLKSMPVCFLPSCFLSFPMLTFIPSIILCKYFFAYSSGCDTAGRITSYDYCTESISEGNFSSN